MLFNFKDTDPWPQATSYWTKEEGTTSADGRYLALMATRYDDAAQTKTAYGLLAVDLRSAHRRHPGRADFPVPARLPGPHQHLAPASTSCPPAHGQGGTRAYTRDFTSSVELTTGSEHSDLVFGPERQDYCVYADYGSRQLVAIDLATGSASTCTASTRSRGEAYALHISGQAFDKPGWAVVSTYADSADYAPSTSPAPSCAPSTGRCGWSSCGRRPVAQRRPHPRGRTGSNPPAREDAGSADGAYFLSRTRAPRAI